MQSPVAMRDSSPSVWQYILSDLARYKVMNQRSYFTVLLICPGSLATIVYRIGHWIWTYKGPFKLLICLWRPPFILLKRFTEMVTRITIEPQATIGRGLYIEQSRSIHINGQAIIGNNCTLTHAVTIGIGGRGEGRGVPVIGDRVYIEAGAKLFGKITVGDDVVIGANAVVTKSLPDRAVAVGVPAQIISEEGSFEYVFYDGRDEDAVRTASLTLRQKVREESD